MSLRVRNIYKSHRNRGVDAIVQLLEAVVDIRSKHWIAVFESQTLCQLQKSCTHLHLNVRSGILAIDFDIVIHSIENFTSSKIVILMQLCKIFVPLQHK